TLRILGVEILRPVDARARVPLQVLALLVEPPQRLGAVLVFPLEDGVERAGNRPRDLVDGYGVAIDACHGGPPSVAREPVRGSRMTPCTASCQAGRDASVEAPALALAPQRRDVDPQAGGGLLQGRRLGQHLTHVALLHVLERGAARERWALGR